MDTFRMFQALDAQTRDAAVDAATDKDEQIVRLMQTLGQTSGTFLTAGLSN